jgi:putative transport protein
MNTLLYTFLIAALGYLVGRIRLFGLQLGTSAVLLVALVFGHFSVSIPVLVRDIGLVAFVASVGLIAGPGFFDNFRKNAFKYVILGLVIVLSGTFVCTLSATIFGLSSDLAAGLMTGALTSTPGLAAAIEASGSDLASVGYGIAYPFGVVGVVLFVQIVPKLLGADLVKAGREAPELCTESPSVAGESGAKLCVVDDYGFFPFTLCIVLGMIIAWIKIPLPNGASFGLGNSGGPLLAGLILGRMGKLGRISLDVPVSTLRVMRELGLMLFLIGAGTGAGSGFVEIVKQQGVVLFLHGMFMTVIPMFIGFLVAYRVMHFKLIDALGSVCGGMTSTPALGALISASKSESVTTSYAATYPSALVCVILGAESIAIFF